MKSSLRIAFECPWCHKLCGYAMDWGGPVLNNETIGRYSGNSLNCVHCKNPIDFQVNVKFQKKES